MDDVPLAAWEPGSGHGDGAGVADDFLGARGRWASRTGRGPARRRSERRAGAWPASRRTAAPSRRRSSSRRPVRGAGPSSRGRLRPPGRGRIPRGRDPEESAGSRRRRARVHRRDHDDVFPSGGGRADADRRLLGPARRRPRRVRAIGVAGIARRPRRARGAPRSGAGRRRDLARSHRRLRRESRLPTAHRRSAGRRGALRRLRLFGDGLQDLAGDRPRRLGASPRRPGEDRGHRALRPRAFRAGRIGFIKAEWEYGDEEPAAYT